MAEIRAGMPGSLRSGPSFDRLTPQLVRQIEESLRRAGPYGEVRLIVAKGKLRFIEVVTSQAVGGTDPKA